MPLTYTRTFRIRSYECDANGHLNNANYLRFMQETAFDASAAAGYGPQRYQEMNSLWLIRESSVEFLIPLRYNDLVEVTTWIADFRRVSSRRAYEFRMAGSGELAARASTDWVYLNASTNLPASIPPTLAADFFPEGVPQSFPPRQPFPKAPAPPAGVFKMRRRVLFDDIDGMRHVNNAIYADYLNECSQQVVAAHGWPWQRMVKEGFGIYIRRLQIQYLQPALLDDELEIATWAFDMRRATAARHYTIQRVSDEGLLCQAQVFAAWIDLANGKPIRIPEDFLNDFFPNIVR